jgi:hypothetical protein
LFPFKIKYSVDIAKLQDEVILSKAEDWLKDNKIQDFYRTSNKIVFKISIMGWSWDKFAAFESGHFFVENSRLILETSMYRMFFIALISSIVIGFQTGWIFAIIIFFFLFLGNAIVGWCQVKKALHKLTEN